eukprot:gene20247-24276_t
MSSDDDDWESPSEEEVYSDEEETPVKKKKAPPKKAAAAPKKAAAAPKKPAAAAGKKAAAARKKKNTSSDEEDNMFVDDSEDDVKPQPRKNISKASKSVEETYQKMDLLDQILLRPDTYVGSTERQEEELWVWDTVKGHMVRRKATFVPGLYKIFDEILVNAADNLQRDDAAQKMRAIKVEIDPENNRISVWNDGSGIPVEMHSKEKMHVPELVFGHLLTSSNYDDSEQRLAGGRNGFGAKLANAFSTKFEIECADGGRKKLFRQTFTGNMKKREEPKITSYSNKGDYTQVTFYPDLSKFGMGHLSDDDNIALLTKRVYDVAGCNPSLKVWLNGKELGIRTFQSYIDLYYKGNDNPPEVYYERVSDRWEIAVSVSDDQFSQVSFVNSICTTKGGTHVTHAIQDVVNSIIGQVTKSVKGMDLKPAFVKNHLFVFVNALIVNPSFDSQTKETLTSKISTFGSKCEPSAKFIKKILDKKSGIVDQIIAYAKHKDDLALKRKTPASKSRGKIALAKLDDANNAGTNKSEDCTLILTEGDSAKTLATAGISIVGRDHYGCFPLRGKPLNVRDTEMRILLANEEITNIVNIMGLQHKKEYDDVKSLRYGHLMIMTDQDHDGSHIKGLLINLIHHFWPSLLRIEGFLVEFITPIVKVFKGSAKPIAFYTIPEFLAWKESHNNGKGYEIKYYKGLGTSRPEEGKEYFMDIEKHKIDFTWDENADDSIDKAFNKKRPDDRKKWMEEFERGTYLDQYGVGRLSITDFVDKELILFSIADCERSIPSLVDGLKTSQRKILYSCFKRNLKKEIRVAQLIGYVSEQSAYHHGEMSLSQAIIGMAQDYVGSNNINLLYPSGSFGSRLVGGKDSSQPRYIHTRLRDITRTLYHAEDDDLLSYTTDDGKRVEPKWYIPVIPMILVNGSAGIGTGWSSTIPNYNPRDLAENMRLMINGEEPNVIMPWYRGFKGPIEYFGTKKSNYVVKGLWKKVGEYKFEVTELPVGHWTQDFKELLDDLADPEGKDRRKEAKAKVKATKGTKAAKSKTTKKKKDEEDEEASNKKVKVAIIKSYMNQSTESKVYFLIETILPVDDLNIEKEFKLSSKLAETNMVLFDEEGRIRKYDTTSDIIKSFFKIRMDYYQKRKDYLCDKLGDEFLRLSNKARFILAVINKELIISNVKKVDLIKKLKEMKFDRFTKSASKGAQDKIKKSAKDKEEEELAAEEEEEGGDSDKEVMDEDSKGYDYLLSLPLWSLTAERVKKILAEKEAKQKELDILNATSISTMYSRDLDHFIQELDTQDQEDEFLRKKSDDLRSASQKKGKNTLPKARKARVTKKKKMDSDDEEEDSDDDYKPKATTSRAAAPKPAVAKPSTSVSKPVPPKRKKDEPVVPAANKIDSYFTSAAAKPKASVVELDSDSDFGPSGKNADDSYTVDSDVEIPAVKKAKPAAAPKKPAAPASKKAAATRKPAAPKKKLDESIDISDDGSVSEGSDDEDYRAPITLRPRRELPKLSMSFLDTDDSDVTDEGSDSE